MKFAFKILSLYLIFFSIAFACGSREVGCRHEITSIKEDGLRVNTNYLIAESNGAITSFADGLQTIFYSTGAKKEESYYVMGFRKGIRTQWYENGNKEFEGYYENGLLEFVSNKWNQEGVLINESLWAKGINVTENFSKNEIEENRKIMLVRNKNLEAEREEEKIIKIKNEADAKKAAIKAFEEQRLKDLRDQKKAAMELKAIRIKKEADEKEATRVFEEQRLKDLRDQKKAAMELKVIRIKKEADEKLRVASIKKGYQEKNDYKEENSHVIKAKNDCAELGFKIGTAKFSNCVVDLSK